MYLPRSFRTKIFLALVVLFFSVSGYAGAIVQSDGAAPVQVTVLFFNDLHGHLMPFEVKHDGGKKEVGGIARLATLIRDIRAENSKKHIHTLVLVAGDILQGTPMSTVFQGEPDVKCLNAMGVDALTVGNHEFDFGLDNFIKLQKLASFPFLSVNIVEKETGRRLCQSFSTIPLRDNLSITIIGVTTRELLTTTKAENVATLRVLESVSSVRQVYDQVKSFGPVLLLSHSRHRTDRSIAEALPDITAIIGGHDQILLSPYRKVGRVPVFQAFEKGRYLGRVDFTIDPVSKKAQLIENTYLPVTADILPDPHISSIVAGYDDRLGEKFKEVIGRSQSFLDGERERIRFQETGLGNFVADIMVEHTGASIALINSGALRASIAEGPITVEDVFKAMPYANELVVVELSGADIRKVLSRSVRGLREDEDGGFLHVSGIAFDIRSRRVEHIRVGKHQAPLDDHQSYSIVIPGFLASGGDDYQIFKGKQQVKTGLPLRELIVDTIRQRGVIAAEVEGRIRRLD